MLTGKDGNFIVSVPSVPGCYTEGKTYEEAVKNIKEAITLSLEVAKDNKNYDKKYFLMFQGSPRFQKILTKNIS